MAEAIPFSIITTLITKLGAAAFNEICLVYGVEDELGKLKDTLSTIQAALLDADQMKAKSHLMQDWIKKLNDAVYDADDLLDAFATKALQRQLNTTTDGRISMKKVRDFFSSSNPLVFRYKLGHSIKEIRERFDEIAANMSKFNFTGRLIVQASVDHSDRETISFVSTSNIIGREKDKEEVLKLIMSTRSNEENVTVITIVGMGGLGKTTLTQLVYNDEKVAEYFELRLWVCVSEDFEQKLLVKKILQSLTKNEVGDLELEQLQIHLRENLDGKRFLLVLDDICNEIPPEWELVKNLLMGGAKGSKIAVTTRSKTVASIMGTENSYILKGLTGKESWNLFEKVAFSEHKMVPPNLVVIGKEIIEKCKGIPLAIQSLASVMQSKTQENEWLSIRNSDVWSLCQDDDDILPILKLSYDLLPIQLRQCFAYCSIFPKDQEIQKEVLIQQWMAQNYVQSSNNIHCLEDVGDQYFKDLLSRSFFQDAKVNDYNEVISCKMHDLMHDLAIRVACSDCSFLETHEDDKSDRVHHVSLLQSKELPRQLLKAKRLRTFFTTCNYNRWYSHQASRSTFMSPNFTCLRVLVVHSYGVCKVPSSIGKLQYLRYLDLFGNRMTSLPNSIRKLVNLQTLILSGCDNLRRLPEGITKLINLRYLVTDDCSSLEHMPTGMEKLTSLRRLNRFVVGGNNNRSVRLSELNCLNELRGDLSIEGLENVRDGESESKEANLKAKQYLQSLRLKWRGEEDGSSKFDGDELLLKAKQFLHCLRLKWKRIVGEDSRKFDDEDILLESLQPHSELKELTIYGYSGGQLLPSWLMVGNMVISLPNIVRITLQYCDRCRHLPPFEQLPCLKVLNLTRMRRVEYQLTEDSNLNLATKSSSSLSSSLFFPSLEELCIEELPNLKGWCNSSSSSSSREGASELLLLWSRQQQRPSFPRLTKLAITECPTLTYMPMIPHVEELYLSRVCEKLLHQVLTTTITEGCASSSSSCSSSIPSFSSPFSSKLRVRSLHISEIEDLESLPDELLQNLTSLEHLKINWCPRLSYFAVSENQNPTLRGLSSLRSLSIVRCDSLTSLSGITQNLTALRYLTIYHCPNFDFSGHDHGVHWQGLRSLRELEIANIPKLASLPVGLQQVTTLQRLEIRECTGLMALPDWISNLNSLQWLYIRGCHPLLTERCQKKTRENWSKISHIPNIEIDGKTIQGRG